ncbi:GNAT family N-acetyltransferase [Salipaludibacillus sp. CUR1]|uniref:GNAT family N-acetyltransferase n=1 Tax=Salipaludibacillus sp. CUR1 TaxID=2820003 RepID=UPI001E3FA56B|nr:GNAT family N-acetyltransferase [Salipaludibacillus sp. CUR1]MCE7792732.1 GNAT family N-acetyltransferase [Salipaludibacillus sp. CUR1]
MKVRKAVKEDIKGIQRVAEDTWHDTYEKLIPRKIQDQFLKNAYSDETVERKVTNSLFLVAEDKGKITGFANFYFKDERADLAAIYIDKEYQTEGIGTSLLNRGLKELPLQVNKVYAEVEKGNDTAEQFYNAKGFTFVKEFEEELFGHKLNTKLMVLNK